MTETSSPHVVKSERGGVIATTSAVPPDLLSAAVCAAPWRGSLTFQESISGSTIAATGNADIWTEARWLAVCHGSITNGEEAAEQLGCSSTHPAALVAAALNPDMQRPSLLRGAFRGVAVDSVTGEVRAIRSLGGARGLAHSVGTKGIAVCAEPEQAAILAGHGCQPDLTVIERYRKGYLGRSDSFISGADWLLPGSWMIADSWSFSISLFDIYVPVKRRPAEQAVLEVTETIDRAVGRAISGAKSVASLATGGLDSSSLIGFAARRRPVDLALTSRVYGLADSAEEAELAESSLAPVVREHRIIDLTIEDLFEKSASWLSVTGPPGVLVFGLMEAGYSAAAEAGADVVMDGIGGDHAFSFDPVAEAITERRWTLLPRQFVRRPRGSIRRATDATIRLIGSDQRHNARLSQRLREWAVHADAVARNRYAAHLDIRLECPYLDEDVWRVVAGVPPMLRLHRRGLQRQAIRCVVPHAETSIKAMYGDAQESYFGVRGPDASKRAALFFTEKWLRAPQPRDPQPHPTSDRSPAGSN